MKSFLYQGLYYDFETKLAYNRYRYYSLETGAYISQDPIGLASANPTLYGYVCDPNILIDFFGLYSKFLFRADDNYRGGDIGNPLGEKDADIKDLYTHIQDKKAEEKTSKVESIVGGKKGKNAAKTMRNNNEVLIEGNIPTSLIQRCNLIYDYNRCLQYI